MITTSHEGLVKHKHFVFTLKNGKRQYSNNNSLTTVSVKMSIWLPAMLLPEYWARFKMSQADVMRTLTQFDKSYICQLLLLLSPIPNTLQWVKSCIRPTYNSLFSFFFVPKKGMLQSIVRLSGYESSHITPHTLCVVRKDHSPLLPMVEVPSDVFQRMRLIVANESAPSILSCVTYPSSYRYRDIDLIPTEYDSNNGLVYMERIIQTSIMNNIHVSAKVCIVNLNRTVQIGGTYFS
jgi:hypothetical protein